MSAVSLLCEIIAQEGKVTADFHGGDKHFAALIRHGLLREAGFAASVVCDDCDEPHSAQVIFENEGYGYICPDLGFVPRAPSCLTLYAPDVSLLASRLADVFDCRQRKSSPLHGQTWRVGAVQANSQTVMIYFHPSLQTEDDARDLQNALGREARSQWRLVVTCQGSFPMADLAVVHLYDLVELDCQSGSLRLIAELRTLAGVPQRNLGGAPNRFGRLLTELIRMRIQDRIALDGRNEEAKAVLALFIERHPGLMPPSISSVKDYVTKVRTGQ